MKTLICWLFGHTPELFHSTDNIVFSDGWGNPMVRVAICSRCGKPYLKIGIE